MRKFTIKKLDRLGITPAILNRYDEPHRYYHNWDHIKSMLVKAKERKELTDDLFLAIVFHDIVYNPKQDDNEIRSAELFASYLANQNVREAIWETKTHEPTSELAKTLCRLDLDVLYSDFPTFIDFEQRIFREYQFADYTKYLPKRIEILENYGINPEWINYVRYRKPSIAVYAGSFNPFHKGHFNILEKAEQIFDKVIIARGSNVEKEDMEWDMPEAIQYRQIEEYDGLLTDFIDSLDYEVTLVRGLRNESDLQNELVQFRYLQDLKPNIKSVSLFCDKEYEHISSSAVRQLATYGKEKMYIV